MRQLGLRQLEQYRNCFCNLAIPVFNMAEAVKPATYKYRERVYSTWDSVKIHKGDITLGELIAVLKAEHDIGNDALLFCLPCPRVGVC